MRYINPGYAEFLDADIGATVEGITYNPDNGVALYQTKVSEGVNFSASMKEFYAKCDVYIPRIADLPSDTFAKIGFLNLSGSRNEFNGLLLYKYSSSYIYIWAVVGNSNDNYVSSGAVKVNFGGVNNFYIHYKAKGENTLDGEYKIYLNGSQILSAKEKWVYMDKVNKLVIHSVSEKCLISNIIMSDAKVSMRERVTAVPLVNPVTDMTAGEDGTYLAEAAGQKILSTADVASLISEYGGASQVTGVAIVGKPAYRTAEGLTTLTGISKADGAEQVEHGTRKLKQSETAGAIDCYAVDATIADMAGMQLGWKAGV